MGGEPFFTTIVQVKVIYREQHPENGGLHFASVLLGVAAGVAGTILYATYNERSFNRVVGKTRELSDRAEEYAGQVGDNVRHKAADMVESARHGVESAGESVRKVVNNATHSVEKATDKVAGRAKDSLEG